MRILLFVRQEVIHSNYFQVYVVQGPSRGGGSGVNPHAARGAEVFHDAAGDESSGIRLVRAKFGRWVFSMVVESPCLLYIQVMGDP